MSQHITILGATSGIGQCAVDEALRRDHTVRAFARSAGDMASRPGLEPFPGDALDPANVADALKGTDAVIYALGIKESVSMLWKEVTLFSETHPHPSGRHADGGRFPPRRRHRLRRGSQSRRHEQR